MNKLLITGSTGKIGPVLVTALRDKYNIFKLNRTGKPSNKYFITDVSNFEALKKVFEKIGQVKYIIHLAADSAVDAPWGSIVTNNIIGTHNIYECARLYKVKRVIYASSNHTTGGYEGIPPTLHLQPNPKMINIHDPIRPDSDYGVSKVFGEATAREYYELYRIESICLRIGTVIKDNNPLVDDRWKKTWLSHRDLVQLVEKALITRKKFGIYYGVSNNNGRFWDISNTTEELGYHSIDNAATYKK